MANIEKHSHPDWIATPSEVVNAGKYLGELEVGDTVFSVIDCRDRLVFGSPTNAIFLESGYIKREGNESTDEMLRELLEDLETFYRDGWQYCTRIVYNKGM